MAFKVVSTYIGAPGVTSAFGPIEQAQTMPISQPARPSYDLGLHCARGRPSVLVIVRLGR